VLRFIVGVICLVLLEGCAVGPPQVTTKTTSFLAPGFASSGTLFVMAADTAIAQSLEFASYKSRFEAKFASKGYTIVQQSTEAQLVAIVSFGIDDGQSSTVSAPLFGQTGGGTTYSSGTVYGSGGSATYSGSTYSMPKFGVVGTTTDSVTTFTRVIAIDVYESGGEKPSKIYEARAKSTGSCNVFAAVFESILEAMFLSFPGESGKTSVANVDWSGNC
jgi:hypothetical protein